jgi:hypothetical protein
MSRRSIVVLAALLLAATGCHHHVDKSEQLAALDDAYHAGLVTKDEYEAKKLAITGAVSAVPATPAATTTSAPPTSSQPATTSVPASEPQTPQLTATQHRSHAPSSAPQTAVSTADASTTGPAATAASTEASHPSANLHANEPAPLPGCEDAEYKSGGQKGTEERFFAASPDTVRNAALSALDSLDFNVHKKSSKEIEASKKRHLGAIVGAGGERVILTFEASERGGRSGTRVTGQTKKQKIVGYMAQKTWTDAVLAEMACKLSEPGH